MKARISLMFLLCLLLLAITPQRVYGQSAGGHVKMEKCSTCGKLKQNCPYKGNHPKPQAKTGTLSITSTPSGAVIKIDGKYKGETPLTLDNQKPGSYSIAFSVEGYETQTKSAIVTAGKTATCSATLKIIERMVLYEGMTYSVKGKQATLTKGKDQETIVIPSIIEDNFGQYRVHSIGEKAFDDFDNVRDVTVSDGIKIIEESAFQWCSNLKSVHFGNSLETIGKLAFWLCKLEKISLPYSLRTIEHGAFHDNGLLSIHIPANVEQIQGNPFTTLNSTKSLTNVTIDNSNKRYYCPPGGNIIIEKEKSRIVIGCNNSIIPSGVKTIGNEAFRGCTIKELEIPEGVEDIEESAFWCCKSLINLKLPSTLRKIDRCAFGHLAISSILFPINTKKIGNMSFCNCNNLKSVFIPASVDQIEGHPFEDCPNLSEIVIHKDNQYYDSRNGCNAIIEKRTKSLINGCKTTTIPNGIEHIGGWAFSGHTGLLSITIPETVKSIGKYAFHETGITNIKIPKDCKYDEENSFNKETIIVTF